MALLAQLRRASAAKVVSVSVVVAALTGCVIFESFGKNAPRFAFSHLHHVVEEGLECEDCHAGATSEDDPGMPVLAQCSLCHDDLDAAKPDDHKITSLFEGGKFKAARRSAQSDEIVFPHKVHAAGGNECSTCHGDVTQNADVLELPRLSMDDCRKCHQEKGRGLSCETCHSRIREDVAPPTHDRLWMESHGKIVRHGADRTADNCSMCHTEASCGSCHFEREPRNHTNYWRQRGHGITASLDRSSCAVCHRDDACVRCHSETRPLSHVGSWGAPVDRHCLSCHFPLAEESCSVCHKATPSHAQAPPKPYWHTPAMNCRQCHFAPPMLTHVDNGDNCNLCHQ